MTDLLELQVIYLGILGPENTFLYVVFFNVVHIIKLSCFYLGNYEIVLGFV